MPDDKLVDASWIAEQVGCSLSGAYLIAKDIGVVRLGPARRLIRVLKSDFDAYVAHRHQAANPLLAILRAEPDDEPLTAEDRKALKEGHEALARGEEMPDEDLVLPAPHYRQRGSGSVSYRKAYLNKAGNVQKGTWLASLEVDLDGTGAKRRIYRYAPTKEQAEQLLDAMKLVWKLPEISEALNGVEINA